jgi:hypothetical protein
VKDGKSPSASGASVVKMLKQLGLRHTGSAFGGNIAIAGKDLYRWLERTSGGWEVGVEGVRRGSVFFILAAFNT